MSPCVLDLWETHAQIHHFCLCVYWPDDEDALGQFPGPLPQSVSSMVAIEGSMLKWKKYVNVVQHLDATGKLNMTETHAGLCDHTHLGRIKIWRVVFVCSFSFTLSRKQYNNENWVCEHISFWFFVSWPTRVNSAYYSSPWWQLDLCTSNGFTLHKRKTKLGRM